MTSDFKQIQETYLAKWIYEQLSLMKDQTLGPTLRMHPQYFDVYDVVQVGLERIIGGKREETFNTVIEVPSPWHAVLTLESLQHHLSLAKQRAIFRGQSDCTWDICPSIHRKGTDIDIENFKARLFCDILSAMSFNTLTTFGNSSKMVLKVPPACYLAAAQHYGIKTNLIDYTPDPAVAVYFASMTSSARENKMASVYAIHLDQAFDNGCEIIIPPPFIERLHIQRGFFIKQAQPNEIFDKSKYAMFEIRFPCDYEFQPFDVIRRGIGRVNILPESPSMNAVLKIVNDTTASNNFKNLTDEQYSKIVESSAYSLKNEFKEVYTYPIEMWAKYVDSFEDMLYWVAYYVDEKQEEVSLDSLIRIIDSNKDLVLSVASFYKWSANNPKYDFTDEKRRSLLAKASILEQPFYNRGELKLED